MAGTPHASLVCVRPLVMLVDDEEDLVWTATRQLASPDASFDLLGFVQPLEALVACPKRPPTVLVTDVRMPNMTGIELLQAVRKHNPNVHVIVTTAFQDDVAVKRVSKDSGLEFLPKPYNLVDLRHRINACLDRPASAGFSGAMAFSQLPDLIQMQVISRASQVLVVEHNGELGKIWFREGNVVHAECGRMIGADAFFRLLGWPAGTFRVEPPPKKMQEPTIRASTMELLMEGVRLLDEAQRSPAPEPTFTSGSQEIIDMANVKEVLQEALGIDGAIGVALVDYKSGMALGTAGGGALLNLEVAAAGNTEVIRAKMKVMASLGLKDSIEDVLITLGSQYHLIRMLSSRPNLFLYLALHRDKANLAMARHSLAELEKNIQV